MTAFQKNSIGQSITPEIKPMNRKIYGAGAVENWAQCLPFHLSSKPILNKKRDIINGDTLCGCILAVSDKLAK